MTSKVGKNLIRQNILHTDNDKERPCNRHLSLYINHLNTRTLPASGS